MLIVCINLRSTLRKILVIPSIHTLHYRSLTVFRFIALLYAAESALIQVVLLALCHYRLAEESSHRQMTSAVLSYMKTPFDIFVLSLRTFLGKPVFAITKEMFPLLKKRSCTIKY